MTTQTPDVRTQLDQFRTDGGDTLLDLSNQGPVLLVFLRHFGCTFCREAMADLARDRDRLKAAGVLPVLVHMATTAIGAEHLARYQLAGAAHVSDPQQALYKAFGLQRGTLGQLFGWKSFTRGFKAGILDGHLVGGMVGDGFQMPGVFLLRDGRVEAGFVHESAADRPDYCALAGG